jgi:hypothetical protein
MRGSAEYWSRREAPLSRKQKDPADQRHNAADAQHVDQEIAGTPFVEDGSHRPLA